MNDLKALKDKVSEVIEDNKERIIHIAEDIFAHPELGYKEERTTALVGSVLKELGLSYEDGLAITGKKAKIAGKEHRLNVCIMGELDSVLCPEHPHADPVTGAAHSCGHNGQIASMLGAGMGLVLSGVMEELYGDVTLLAVPAEEYVEIEYRNALRKEGKISFLGGKQEMIAIGALDDVDISMLTHAASFKEGIVASVGGTSNGFLGKSIAYKGREAHAGGAPQKGVNALKAAMLGLTAIDMQRETLYEDDTIRIHPIITKGGDLVNIIPADVRVETYVRGKNMPAIVDASKMVDRCLKAGAMAFGAEVTIESIPGYLPLSNHPGLSEIHKENLESLTQEGAVLTEGHGTGSTDMGDVSAIMPAIHPRGGGIKGQAHTKDYEVTDPYMAYVLPAKAMALTALDLLYDGAKRGLEIKNEFKPLYDRQSYLKMWSDLLEN